MLKTHYLHLFNRLFAIQLFIIWLLGCIGVFGSESDRDSLAIGTHWRHLLDPISRL